MEKLPSEIEKGKDADHSVGEEECRNGPFAGQENRVATNKCHDGGGGAGDVGDVGLEPALVR